MSQAIDRSSPLPYYAQVKEFIRERINDGTWEPGTQIPGEPELCRIFDVSRTVIRQALQELMHEGLINRRKGKGTFVAEQKLRGSLVQKLTGFHENMASLGLAVRSKVLKQHYIAATVRVARLLSIEPGATVIEIERVRYVQDEPVVLVTTYLPFELCPNLIQVDLREQSLYNVLENQCGLKIARGRRMIEAVLANDYEASLLAINQSDPLIMLDSVSYLRDGTPIEYYHALHRGDRSRFEVELVRVVEKGEEHLALTDNDNDLPTSNGMIVRARNTKPDSTR